MAKTVQKRSNLKYFFQMHASSRPIKGTLINVKK